MDGEFSRTTSIKKIQTNKLQKPHNNIIFLLFWLKLSSEFLLLPAGLQTVRLKELAVWLYAFRSRYE